MTDSGADVPTNGKDRRRPGVLNRIRRKILRGRVHANGNDIHLDPDIVMAISLCGLVLLGCLVTLALVQQGKIRDQQKQISRVQIGINANQDKLQQQQVQLSFVERRDRINSYQTAYRFCSRINNDRAALHYLVGSNQPRARAQQRLRRLERREGLPILDCNPNITGDPATYMPPIQQQAFVERWRKGDLTPAEIGICRVKIGSLSPPGTCDE